MDEQRLTKKQLREMRRQEKSEQQQSAGRKKMQRGIFVWGGTIIGLGLLIWGLVYLAKGNGNGQQATGTVDPVTAEDHIRGDQAAPAVLIEYSDFQCPACGSYEPVVQQLTDSFGEKLAVVYRHYPLKSIHPNAEAAALASEAADLQGAFWAYHDVLFDRQSEWAKLPSTSATFQEYAQELGLNVDTFKSDSSSSQVKQRVNEGIASGNRLGVQGTPTFVLNGKVLDNPRTLEDFEQLINDAISQAS